jgi:SAM-dependent methyltransferase
LTEHLEAARIRRFFEELASKGPAVATEYFCPDVIWHVGRGHPGNGTYRGIDGLVEYFELQRTSPADGVDFKSASILADDSLGAIFVDVALQAEGMHVDLLIPQLFQVGSDGLWDEYWVLEPGRRSPPLPETAEAIKSSDAFKQYWYYSMELVPGLFTPGVKHLNLGLTRNLLSRCEVSSRKCLDIGTMEGAVPVLLSRRGADPVVAVDVLNCGVKILMVKHFTGAQFNYRGGLTHLETAPLIRRRYGGDFDLVVLSGVLYHCFGPLHVLATARSLLRTGGLMIVETFAAVDEQQAMFFNARGTLSPDASTYFLISVPLLEYLLRYFKLRPIDCVQSPAVMVAGRKSARVAVACRATNELDPDVDPWMKDATGMIDYRTLIDWDLIDTSGDNPPDYAAPASRFIDAGGRCDVTRTVFESPALELRERVAMIGLEDLY